MCLNTTPNTESKFISVGFEVQSTYILYWDLTCPSVMLPGFSSVAHVYLSKWDTQVSPSFPLDVTKFQLVFKTLCPDSAAPLCDSLELSSTRAVYKLSADCKLPLLTQPNVYVFYYIVRPLVPFGPRTHLFCLKSRHCPHHYNSLLLLLETYCHATPCVLRWTTTMSWSKRWNYGKHYIVFYSLFK